MTIACTECEVGKIDKMTFGLLRGTEFQRHPGFDVGFDWLLHPAFEDRIRSVNWLPFLGSDLAKAVDSTQLSSSIEVNLRAFA